MRTASPPGAELSIIIPAWNERANLELLLPELKDVVGRLAIQTEIIVVDGGSADGTTDSATRLGARVVLQQERGYGGALTAGFEACQAPYILTMDADLSHPAQFVQELWKRRDEADVLIASRYVPGGAADMSAFRRLLSQILNRTFGLLLGLPFRDLSSGFRQYHRHAVIGLRPVARDFDVLEEILIQAYVNGASVQEVPFHYKPRGSGSSHARLIKFGWAYLRTLFRMSKLRFRSKPRAIGPPSSSRPAH